MTERIVVAGIGLECRRVGAADAGRPTLVLLHEGLGSVSTWRDFPDRLARATGLAVFLYSRQGYGGSDPIELPRPLDYLEREARLLPAVLAAAGIGRAVLVGHSDGANIALHHAASGNGDTLAVVAMAPHSLVEPVTLAGIRLARDAFQSGGLRERLARHHGANVDAAFRGWCDTWLDPRFANLDLRPILASIRAPLLLIQGEDDEYGSPAQVEIIAAGSPAARTLLLPACGHAPHRDQPQAVLAAIGELVAGI